MQKFLVLLMLLISYPVLAESYSTVDVGKNLVVRAMPSVDAPHLFMLKGGTPVKKLDTNEETGFVKIETDDKKVGWTKKSNIVVRADTAPAAKEVNVTSQHTVPAILHTSQKAKPANDAPAQVDGQAVIAPPDTSPATTTALATAPPGVGVPISADTAKIAAAQQMNESQTVSPVPNKQCDDTSMIGLGHLLLIFAALLACTILITSVATRMRLEKKYVLLER